MGGTVERAWWAAMAVVVSITGCGGTDATAEREVLVSAAASLTDAFGEIEAAFEADHPGVDVLLNFGGSSTLRGQIREGAPADVFASANTSTMDDVVEAGDAAADPQIFARNRLQIAVPSGNPAGVTGVSDFADEELLLGLCAETVPCGDLAREVLAAAGVEPAVDTNEPDVRALLTKIEAGELDAGITYETDVASTAGAVEGVDIPDEYNVVADYPITVLAGAANSDDAAAFVDFVLSDDGREILDEYGFASP